VPSPDGPEEQGGKRQSRSPTGVAIPTEIVELAQRLGAGGDVALSAVSLAQTGAMRATAGARFTRFTARETISLRRPEFEWRASTGPFRCITAVDALKDCEGSLEIRAFGFLRLARMHGGPAAAKAEIMRYLAELAWAPDAILDNPALVWRVIDRTSLCVAARCGAAHGGIALKLDGDGRIAAVSAPDRPRQEGAGFKERPWRGRFFDYRRHRGRWLPFRGEVGWVVDGKPFVAWRGELTEWELVEPGP
jgi:hypothetical protein